MKFKPFSEVINESLVNESLKSPALSKMLASNDANTKQVIRDIAKKDKIALSNLTDDDIMQFIAWSPKDVKQQLQFGKSADRPRRQRTAGGKRRIIGYDKETNKIVISAIYQNEEITIDFVDNPKVKNFNQFFKEYDHIFGRMSGQTDFFVWLAIEFPSSKDLTVIDADKKQKELQHVFKRESAEFRNKLQAEDAKIKQQVIGLIKKITGTKADLSNTRVSQSRIEVMVTNAFGHGFEIYMKSDRGGFGSDVRHDSTPESITIEIGGGTMGAQDPIKMPDYFERFRIMGVLGKAVIEKNSDIEKIKELCIQLAKNEKAFDEFTFEVDGKVYKSGFGKFEEVPQV